MATTVTIGTGKNFINVGAWVNTIPMNGQGNRRLSAGNYNVVLYGTVVETSDVDAYLVPMNTNDKLSIYGDPLTTHNGVFGSGVIWDITGHYVNVFYYPEAPAPLNLVTEFYNLTILNRDKAGADIGFAFQNVSKSGSHSMHNLLFDNVRIYQQIFCHFSIYNIKSKCVTSGNMVVECTDNSVVGNIYNCTLHNIGHVSIGSNTFTFTGSINSLYNIRNIVCAIEKTSSSMILIGTIPASSTLTVVNCATNRGTFNTTGSPNNLNNIVLSDEFLSIDQASADYLIPKSTGLIYKSGVANIFSSADIAGKSIPDSKGYYPIGANACNVAPERPRTKYDDALLSLLPRGIAFTRDTETIYLD